MSRWPLAMLIAACGCTTSDPAGTATDAWVGRWIGPEATYLELAGANGAYEVTIKDLDAARTFTGAAAGDRIEFPRRRDGVDSGDERRCDGHEVVGRKTSLPHDQARRRILPRLSEPERNA